MVKSAIKVAVRVRPLGENDKNTTIAVKTTPETIRCGGKIHKYDYVFESAPPRQTRQVDIFSAIGEEVLDHALAWKNTCVFAYGQTGSGKTYTMVGKHDIKPDNSLSKKAGLIPRIVSGLFSRIQTLRENNPADEYNIDFSFVEIYNEKISDLVGAGNGGAPGARLEIRTDKTIGPYVHGASKTRVATPQELMNLFNSGAAARHVTATAMNSQSSRSHIVAVIYITAKVVSKSGVPRTRSSQINLVDLAGSERVKKSKVRGQALKEATKINGSLLALGKVIRELAEKSKSKKKKSLKTSKGSKKSKSFKVYRESVLTHLLSRSLGDNSMTYLIAAISPSKAHLDETNSTLSFANTTGKIVMDVKANVDPGESMVQQMEATIDELTRQLESAKQSGDSEQVQALERELETQRAIALQDTASWEEKIAQSETALDDMRSQLEQAHRELAAERTKAAESIKAAESAAEESIKAAELQVKSAAAELDRERETRDAVSAQLAKTIMEDTNARITAVQQDNLELQQELHDAQVKVTSLQDNLSVERARALSTQAENAELSAQLADALESLAESKTTAVKQLSELALVRQKTATLTDELEHYKSREERQSDSTAALEARIQAFEDRNRELLHRNEDLVRESAEVRTAAATAAAESSAEIELTSEQNHLLNEKCARLTAEVEVLNQQLQQTATDKQATETANEVLNTRVSTLNTQLASLRAMRRKAGRPPLTAGRGHFDQNAE